MPFVDRAEGGRGVTGGFRALALLDNGTPLSRHTGSPRLPEAGGVSNDSTTAGVDGVTTTEGIELSKDTPVGVMSEKLSWVATGVEGISKERSTVGC